MWESKKFKYLAKGGAAHGTVMLTARAQAEDYADALPPAELAAGRPPFVNADKRLTGIVALGDFAVDSADIAVAGEALAEISQPS